MTLPVRNARIRLPQGQLFSREVGHGGAIVFLHGSWSDGSEWLPIMEHVGARFHCLAPDLLGCGESDRSTAKYSVDVQVESLADYLEALKLRDVLLVGRELGGWIAASYTLRYGAQVRGLVLMGAEGVKLSGKSDRWRWERWLTARPPLLAWLLQLLLPIAGVVGQAARIHRALRHRQQLRRSPAACQILFQRRRVAIEAEGLDGQLQWLKLPLLLLEGEADRSIAPYLNHRYAVAPHAIRRSVPGSDDFLQTHPVEVAREIEQFLLAHQADL